MTALAANAVRDRKPGDVFDLPLDLAVEHFYKGALLCRDTTGYGVVGADTANYVFAGVAMEEYDQAAAAAADGTNHVKVYRRGVFKFTTSGAAITDVGRKVFLSDDNTVTLTPGYVFVGVIVRYESATSVWVDIEPAVKAASGGKVTVTCSLPRTAANQTDYMVAFTCPAGRKATVLAAKVAAIQVPVYATSELLNLYKYDLSATADEAVLETADYDLGSLTAKQAADLTLQSTDPTYLDLDPGDVLYARVAIVGAETTAGLGISVTFELSVN